MKLQTPPTLRPGDASPFVSVWQLHGLVPRGLLPSSQVTGTMDKATIEATRAYQRANKLHVDGIVGPLTWGWAGFVRPSGDGVPGDEYALRFPRLPARKKAVRGIVLHQTVTRAKPAATELLVDWHACKRTFNVLTNRGLSTDAIIGPYGSLYRTSDPTVERTRHAGAYNQRWLGVDVVNPVDEDVSGDFDDTIWPIATAPFAPASDGRRYHEDTEEALHTLDAWLREQCEQWSIPYKTAKAEHTLEGADPDTLPPGVYAHGHLSGDRWDGHGTLRKMRQMGIGPEWAY